MESKTVLWYAVLGMVTAGYLVTLAGVRAAKQHDLPHHSSRILAACTIIGLWLVAYVIKQALFGRERFGGTESQYWRLYVPILSFHMMCAVSTIGLGVYNLYMGLTRLRPVAVEGFGRIAVTAMSKSDAVSSPVRHTNHVHQA